MQTWIMVIIRTASLFILTLIIIRIMGKSSLSRATPYKLMSYLVTSLIITLLILGIVKNEALGIISLAVWILLYIAVDYLSIKSKIIHDLVNGKETILIKNGKIMENNLMKVRFTGEELLRELRSKNAFNLADVEFAVMECTGDINVLLKSNKKPITPHDMKIQIASQPEAQTVILDGNILDDNLSNLGFNREWLNNQLSNLSVLQDNVFIAQVDSSGDLYIDLFEDSIEVTHPKVKELLYANLEKVYADLLSFEQETEDISAKQMYSRNAVKLNKILNKLEPHLLR